MGAGEWQVFLLFQSNQHVRVKRFPRCKRGLDLCACMVSLVLPETRVCVFPFSGDSPCAKGLFLNVSSSSPHARLNTVKNPCNISWSVRKSPPAVFFWNWMNLAGS